jgi:hypothetical protein
MWRPECPSALEPVAEDPAATPPTLDLAGADWDWIYEAFAGTSVCANDTAGIASAAETTMVKKTDFMTNLLESTLCLKPLFLAVEQILGRARLRMKSEVLTRLLT